MSDPNKEILISAEVSYIRGNVYSNCFFELKKSLTVTRTKLCGY